MTTTIALDMPAATIVAVRQLSGVGSVLVDSAGLALYTPDQDASGTTLCTGPCNAFWKPLYTLVQDSPGNSTGDGFNDDFNGHRFVWHVVRSAGSTGGAGPSSGSTGSSGYGY